MAKLGGHSDKALSTTCPACIQLQVDHSASGSTILQFPASKPITWGAKRPNCALGSYLFGLEHNWSQDINKFLVRNWRLGDMCLWNGEKYDLYEEKDGYVFPTPTLDRGDPNFTSKSSIAKLQNWLEACDTEPIHNICRSPRAFMPSRVIDVTNASETHRVRLIDAAGMKEEYIALSHCWGTSRKFLLTTSTILEARTGITIGLLAKTFRDAIWLTLKLGKKYLWIDSLCIIQDDEDDWLIESRQMRHIYWHSYLTIAAANAKDDNDGFLRLFDIWDVVELVITPPRGKTKYMYLQRRKAWLQLVNEKRGLPLNNRGWTLQERFLPHRAVCYEADYMGWACRYQEGKLVTGIWNDFWHLRTHLHWRKMIQQYTRRTLTYEKDKLPAISGLAEMFAETTKDKYCAGLWWGGLGEDLLWMKEQGRGWDVPDGILARPKDRSGPSWSWASLDGPIDFIMTKNNPVTIIYESKFIKCDIKLRKTENPYGEIQTGLITVEGPLRPLVPIMREAPERSTTSFDIEEFPKTEVFELVILRATDSVHSGMHGPVVLMSLYGILVVKKTSNPDTYARVGFSSRSGVKFNVDIEGDLRRLQRRIVLV